MNNQNNNPNFVEMNGLLKISRYKKQGPKIELLIYNAPFTNKLKILNLNNINNRAIIKFKNDYIYVKQSRHGNRFCPRNTNQFSTLCLSKIISKDKKSRA